MFGEKPNVLNKLKTVETPFLTGVARRQLHPGDRDQFGRGVPHLQGGEVQGGRAGESPLNLLTETELLDKHPGQILYIAQFKRNQHAVRIGMENFFGLNIASVALTRKRCLSSECCLKSLGGLTSQALTFPFVSK